jgi:hypothetical protein
MGNAVDKQHITEQLESLARAGIGGVEITPIYGVNGEEEKYIAYLSPKWMEMLEHTLREAERLGMQVDMNMGTGWPFGGPQITSDLAASRLVVEKYTLQEGERLTQLMGGSGASKSDPDGTTAIQILTASGDNGSIIDLVDQVDNRGQLNWTAEKGQWQLYAGYCAKTMQRVKRAAPGGEGLTMDHLSEMALQKYVQRFDEVFRNKELNIRAVFNDSYEVYNADWTPSLLQAFEDRR